MKLFLKNFGLFVLDLCVAFIAASAVWFGGTSLGSGSSAEAQAGFIVFYGIIVLAFWPFSLITLRRFPKIPFIVKVIITTAFFFGLGWLIGDWLY